MATEPCGRGEVVFVFNKGSTRDTDQLGRAAREPHRGRLGVEVESARLDEAFRKVATFIFIGALCVNDCGWRLSPVK